MGRRAELGHGPPEQGVVHVEDQGRSRAGLGQLHLGQDIGHVIQALAAVFPGESQAEHAFPGPELEDLPGKLGFPVQSGGQVFHFPGQTLRLFLDPLLFR